MKTDVKCVESPAYCRRMSGESSRGVGGTQGLSYQSVGKLLKLVKLPNPSKSSPCTAGPGCPIRSHLCRLTISSRRHVSAAAAVARGGFRRYRQCRACQESSWRKAMQRERRAGRKTWPNVKDARTAFPWIVLKMRHRIRPAHAISIVQPGGVLGVASSVQILDA